MQTCAGHVNGKRTADAPDDSAAAEKKPRMEPQALPAKELKPAVDAESKPAAGAQMKRARTEGADDAVPAKGKAAKAAAVKPDGGGSAAPAVGKAANGKAAKAAAPKLEAPPAQVGAGSSAPLFLVSPFSVPADAAADPYRQSASESALKK